MTRRPTARSTSLSTPVLNRCAVALCTGWVVVGCAPKPTPGPASGAGTSSRAPVVRAPTEAEDAVLLRASGAVDAQEYAQALSLFRELLARNPMLVDAQVGLAGTFEAMGDLDRAEPAFARAVALDAESFDAQFGYGRVLAALDKTAEAIRAFHRALVLRPDSLAANIAMAMAYLRAGEAERAVAFAEKAVQIDPTDGEARVRLAVAYERTGRNVDAIRTLEVALELIDPRPDVLITLVNLYAAERRYVEAINTAQELIRIAPSANAWERLGWAYFRVGDYAKSAESYRQGVALDPDNWPSLNGVATNALNRWLQSGKLDDAARIEARQAFRRSLQVNPDQPRVVALVTKYAP